MAAQLLVKEEKELADAQTQRHCRQS